MRPTLLIESAAQGLLYVNGQFCGPVDREGQAFPAGRQAEIYIQIFPFGEGFPLTAQLLLREGRIERLEPQQQCFALIWPDGVIQLELRLQTAQDEEQEMEQTAPDTLLRYLAMRLAGDQQAAQLWLRPQDEMSAPDLSAYHAAVPLRFAPSTARERRYDARAGLVRRTAPNIAYVDAALAMTVPAGQGRRLIERMDIHQT